MQIIQVVELQEIDKCLSLRQLVYHRVVIPNCHLEDQLVHANVVGHDGEGSLHPL